MSRELKINGLYRHFKGGCYRVLCLALDTETGVESVVYQHTIDHHRIYVRPLMMFLSPVDKDKYPESKQEYRFELID